MDLHHINRYSSRILIQEKLARRILPDKLGWAVINTSTLPPAAFNIELVSSLPSHCFPRILLSFSVCYGIPLPSFLSLPHRLHPILLHLPSRPRTPPPVHIFRIVSTRVPPPCFLSRLVISFPLCIRIHDHLLRPSHARICSGLYFVCGSFLRRYVPSHIIPVVCHLAYRAYTVVSLNP